MRECSVIVPKFFVAFEHRTSRAFRSGVKFEGW